MTPEVNVQFVEQHFHVEARNGREYSVRCPIHNERHASMRINVDKGVYYCHGCKAKGGMVKLARLMGVAYRYNKAEAGMSNLMNKLDLLRRGSDTQAEAVLSEDTLKRYALPTAYWTDPRPSGRGFAPETVEAFDLGYDPMTESAIIPIRNMWGDLLGVTKRSLRKDGTRSRYIDPKGFKKRDNLFGSWFVAEAETPYVVLVEGPLDCIKVWEAGHPCVALYGSYASPTQIMMLRRMGIVSAVMFFDNDKQGKAVAKQCKGFVEDGVEDGKTKWKYTPETDLRKFFVLKNVSYAGLRGNDPGDMSIEDIDKGVTSAKLTLR